MKYTKYPELKAELKEIAKEIRIWKSRRKQDKREGCELWRIHLNLSNLKDSFRKKHIVYCMLRGRYYYEIEKFTKRPLKEVEWRVIYSTIEEYKKQRDLQKIA